jgi:hypothetical protein
MTTVLQEGFWWSEQEPWYPMPQPYTGPWHDRALFIEQLKFVQERCQVRAYRGSSSCRLCDNRRNGSETYSSTGWEWPSGYLHYIEEHGVRPSLAFEKFILDKQWADMPRYKQWYDQNVLQPRLALIRKQGMCDHVFEYDGSSPSGSENYYKCSKCEVRDTRGPHG